MKRKEHIEIFYKENSGIDGLPSITCNYSNGKEGICINSSNNKDFISQAILMLESLKITLEHKENKENRDGTFHFEKFKQGKQIVLCKTLEESIMFFAYLIEKGCNWRSGRKLSLSDTKWEIYKSNTCYEYDNGIFFGNCTWETCSYVDYEHIPFTLDIINNN